MKKNEIEELVKEQRICRIVFKGKEYPHIAIFQYTFLNDSLYFHFTDYGTKIELLRRGKRVCVEIEKFGPDLSEFKFAILRGKLNLVKDSYEVKDVIRKMVKEGKRELSPNFLVAHGFKSDANWDSFKIEKDLKIVKLEETEERIGLKSK